MPIVGGLDIHRKQLSCCGPSWLSASRRRRRDRRGLPHAVNENAETGSHGFRVGVCRLLKLAEQPGDVGFREGGQQVPSRP
jgi:hypothetical protein